MSVSISALGFATAQGNTTAVCNGDSPRPPASWPWPANRWTTSFLCRPAQGMEPAITGIGRWQALLNTAMEDCFGSAPPEEQTPVFIASCNGAVGGFDQNSWRASFDSTALLAGTPWSGARVPVFSSSCNSGMHALYAATQAIAAGAKEAVVIAADILSESNQSNFECLRVLAESSVAPWQPEATGFLLGETAVVLKITLNDEGQQTFVHGPALTNAMVSIDGCGDVVAQLSPLKSQLIIGQGTGPAARDERELATFNSRLDQRVPITTPLLHFGHTLGASGLLSVALAALCLQKQRTPTALTMPAGRATDERPLADSSVPPDLASILVASEALDGSCAGVVISNADARVEPLHPSNAWRRPIPEGALMHPVLRRIAEGARSYRPPHPPNVLLVRMDEPLAPASEAWVGERLLPSAVLEITPGFVSQLISRTWGFAGPALCQVGSTSINDRWALKTICKERDATVAEVSVVGTGDDREIIWNN